MTRTVFRTTLPDVPLPTADDLQPLYDAALDYGKASVATSRKYTELKDGQYGGTSGPPRATRRWCPCRDDGTNSTGP